MQVRLIVPFMMLLVRGMSGWGPTVALPENAALSGVYRSVVFPGVAHSGSAIATARAVPAWTPIGASTRSPSALQVLAAADFSNPYTYSGDCIQAAYVSDVSIPDGTVLTPGETFAKIWRLENTGSCPWNKGYSMTLVGGTAMYGTQTEIGRRVKPGKQVNVSVALTAPDADGTYTGYWALADKSGTAVGEAVSVQIVVSAAAAASNP